MRKPLLAIFCCSLLTGCSQDHIVDRINILQSMGVDMDGETVKMSASYPKYIKGAGEQSPITAESNVMYGVFTALTAKSTQPVEIGQLRTLVISESFAQRAIPDLADIINREIIKSSNTTIVITKQTASSIIAKSSKEQPYYLSELIEQNIFHGNTPRTNYHSFVNQYYGEGQDVYLPVINEAEGLLHMDGVAVFKGDELKLWLDSDEGLYLKLLKDKKLNGEYDFKTGPKAMYSFVILRGKSRIDSSHRNKTRISLQLSIQIREIPEKLSLEKEADLNAVRKQIEEQLNSAVKSLLIRLQKNKTDPVGLGEQYRRSHRSFSEDEFYGKIYPRMDFEVKTNIIILHSGVGR
ncbi:Ger(x)C family germination protein [Paenibacillus taihuensis]|uniref:Ger(X)C family germination protein n=1 Tax=Paenibacillus taihuensis TaxID=1156355 RepID=A0A3D9S8C2_9BACL|nr:Ger(x)C family spore germination protein [Paenibacillus taihuensis]REE88965.1 Ger(x)C family germination protein [Paenibacillus taihuensis]